MECFVVHRHFHLKIYNVTRFLEFFTFWSFSLLLLLVLLSEESRGEESSAGQRSLSLSVYETGGESEE